MNYLIHLLIYFDIYVIVALSLNLIVGYCGLLSLSHAGYYAVGAYTYALLAKVAGWEFIPAMLVAVLLASVFSLAISLSAWRLKGDFFFLATLAVQAMLYSIFNNWNKAGEPLGTWINLTNGPFGITNIPSPKIMGMTITDSTGFLVLATGMAVLCAVIFWRLQVSPWGRLLVSMREDELAARSLGKNTRLLKVQVLAISSGLVAVAGVLYAAHVGYLDPSTASLEESVIMLSMVMVGGVGNFRGPVIGAFILIALPEVLRYLHLPDAQAGNIRLAIYGLLLVLLMHFRPQGVSGEYRMN